MDGTENITVDLFIRSVWITEIGSKVDCTIVYSDNELGLPHPLKIWLVGLGGLKNF
jgi:hypothetical protein